MKKMKKMKKIGLLALVLCLVLGMCACSKEDDFDRRQSAIKNQIANSDASLKKIASDANSLGKAIRG